MSTTDLLTTYTDRQAHEIAERAEKRRLELEQQRSTLNPPGVRVSAWERVHALRLPRDPAHPILYIIATDTGLTLAQVQEEQRTRFKPRVGVAQQPEAS